MQDRYTGDVGDFGKYGLLRWLRGYDADPLRLGVVWYRTDSRIVAADPANDGKHISYLRPRREQSFRPCDPPLYDGLREIVNRRDRRVQAVAQSGLLGPEPRRVRRLRPRGRAPSTSSATPTSTSSASSPTTPARGVASSTRPDPSCA